MSNENQQTQQVQQPAAQQAQQAQQPAAQQPAVQQAQQPAVQQAQQPAAPAGEKPTGAYQSIIEQQNNQIAALIAQNDALSKQITQMVQNGAQFSQPAQQPASQTTFNPDSLADDKDWSLEGLASEIGKPAKH